MKNRKVKFKDIKVMVYYTGDLKYPSYLAKINNVKLSKKQIKKLQWISKNNFKKFKQKQHKMISRYCFLLSVLLLIVILLLLGC